jgi:hypothetical protein
MFLEGAVRPLYRDRFTANRPGNSVFLVPLTIALAGPAEAVIIPTFLGGS